MSIPYQIKVIYDRRKKASATVKGTVEIEIYCERQRIRISTGVRVLKQQWKLGQVVEHADADSLNRQIEDVRKHLDERMRTMAKEGKVNLDSLKVTQSSQTTKVVGGHFMEWLYERIMAHRCQESTRKHHMTMYRDLERFGLIKRFSDLTPRNIMLWNDSLTARLSNLSTIHNYHKSLRPYIVEAIKFELLSSNPYDKVKFSRGGCDTIRYLTTDERKRIEELELFGPVDKARDMLIFACYTGLAYSDYVKINRDDVVKIGDEYFINDFRQKTKAEYNIMLLPPALAILQKYNYSLNLMSDQKANYYLKLVANMAGIRMNLTTHVGRHTFATWALNEGVDIATVSRMLAHRKVTTTERYARVLQKKLTDGFNFLKGRL